MPHFPTAASVLALFLPAAALAQPTPDEVVDTYAQIGEAVFGDAAAGGQALLDAVNAFLEAPSEAGLTAARDAWRAARVPYMQTEVFRFGNPVVDAWEGKVNAWPLDEGLIDYTDPATGGPTGENPLAGLDIVANPQPVIGGAEIDATEITPQLIGDTLNEAEGIETNVARGYHAVEFLLWGQDLNGTDPGAGDRPWTDYAQGEACTHGNCDRRAEYLRSATQLLADDLAEMAANWQPGGTARAVVTESPAAGITALLTGMGSLSYGEMAGERMQLGLLLNDPEEEQDCFSDNTPWSAYYDQQGILNLFNGRYQRLDGSVIEGAALSDLIAGTDPALQADMSTKLTATLDAMAAITEAASNGMAWDMMLAPGNDAGDALLSTAIDALIDQTRSIERVVKALGADSVSIEGSDAL